MPLPVPATYEGHRTTGELFSALTTGSRKPAQDFVSSLGQTPHTPDISCGRQAASVAYGCSRLTGQVLLDEAGPKPEKPCRPVSNRSYCQILYKAVKSLYIGRRQRPISSTDAMQLRCQRSELFRFVLLHRNFKTPSAYWG